jgi:FMN reductase [NAD(P)H]
MFKLPKGVFPVVLLCMGYPKARPKPRNKLDTGVVVHSERYCELGDQELLHVHNKKYRGERIAISEERLETVLKVCREVHGEEFAKRCADRIKKNGYINRAQYYFGLHYRADQMPKGNDEYMRLMEEFGFTCFKKYTMLSASAKAQMK